VLAIARRRMARHRSPPRDSPRCRSSSPRCEPAACRGRLHGRTLAGNVRSARPDL